MRSEPGKITIGVSGTVGSQDWLKVAMIARRAGVDPRNFRFVALEGGGDSFTALQANHVQVISGDASEAASSAKDGKFRVLAVLSEQRLPGALAEVPTAREQGFDVVWPIIRGFYMSAQVSDADYQRWVEVFDRTMATEEFKRQRAAGGLYPFAMTGEARNSFGQIRESVDVIRDMNTQIATAVGGPLQDYLIDDRGAVDQPADGADIGPARRWVVENARVLGSIRGFQFCGVIFVTAGD